MANGIINLGSNASNLEGRIVWESSSNGSESNSSYVAGHLQVRRNDGYTTKGTWTGAMNIAGVVNSFSNASTTIGSSWITMIEFSVNPVRHNDNGTGNCYFEAYCNAPSGTSLAGKSVSGKQTIQLDTIPRYANLLSLTVKSKTVNSITLQYTTDKAARLFCSIDGGSTWLNNGNPFKDNTTSGEFTVYYQDRAGASRLTTNTLYNFTVLCRSVSSGLDTTKSISASTYDIARLVNVPNINIRWQPSFNME